MGNLMIGNSYPPKIQLGGVAVSKIMCGTEQCWPAQQFVIPQGGIGVRLNGQTLDYWKFADVYENYEQLKLGEYRSFDNSHTFHYGTLPGFSLQIWGNFNIEKGELNPMFGGNVQVLWYEDTILWSEPEELYYDFDQMADDHLDWNKNYILDITVNENPTPTWSHQLRSSDHDKYKNFGTIYVLRERSWDRFTSHQLIAQYSLLDSFMPIWNGEMVRNRKQGNGTFDTDGQAFSGQNYRWTADFEKTSLTEYSRLYFETDDTAYTFDFSSGEAFATNNPMAYDWVILLTPTGPVMQRFTAQWLGRKYTIENTYSFRSPVSATTRGAQTAMNSTWIDLILKRQSSEKQVILNKYTTAIAEYTTLWWYNIKDRSMWRRVQIVDYTGRNILDTSALVNGVYKVDPCQPDREVVLPPTMMSVNDNYTV